MASTLIKSLIAGSLIVSSSVATAQATSAPLQPAVETDLGANGESRAVDESDAVMGIIFALVVFTIAIWVGRDNAEEEGFVPQSP